MGKQISPIQLYCKQMEEVKYRINVMTHFLSSPGSALYFHSAIESAALQMRKILERIAFGSLIANKRIYTETYDNFSTTWKANLLLKDLARVNPRFYPIPCKPNPVKRDDGVFTPELLLNGYLTPKDFEQAYEACHSILHATNPSRGEIDMTAMSIKLKTWQRMTVCLLNIHQVYFVDQKSIWEIHMQEENDDHVHFYEFERIEK